MKNAEGIALPFELERRLKQSTDRLRDVRETMEELGRSAGALHRLFGVEQAGARPKAAPPPPPPARPAVKPAEVRPQQKGPVATTPPPAKVSQQPAPSSAPPTPATAEDEIPEWRKVFPELSAEVPPGRKK